MASWTSVSGFEGDGAGGVLAGCLGDDDFARACIDGRRGRRALREGGVTHGKRTGAAMNAMVEVG